MPHILKNTYLNFQNKIETRDFLFTLPAFKNCTDVIGLGGPDINEYMSKLRSYGFKNITIYENDIATFLRQIQVVEDHNFKHIFGDIVHAAPNMPNTLYDLDFCVTPRTTMQHIIKFTENFIMTFSRRIPDEESIKRFFDARGENLIFEEPKKSPIPHVILHTNTGAEYIKVNYRSTSNMFCITKIK
jgi:hypothetical protein